jgi:hypothetical protein
VALDESEETEEIEVAEGKHRRALDLDACV